jgi:hypothetical protein
MVLPWVESEQKSTSDHVYELITGVGDAVVIQT